MWGCRRSAVLTSGTVMMLCGVAVLCGASKRTHHAECGFGKALATNEQRFGNHLGDLRNCCTQLFRVLLCDQHWHVQCVGSTHL